MLKATNTFKKQERLCSLVEIQQLLTKGDKFMLYPLSIKFSYCTISHQSDMSSPKVELVRVLLSCPKRYQKLAVNRNKVKRLLKETYRINKQPLFLLAQENNIAIKLSISVVNSDIPNYHELNQKMKEVIGKLVKKIEKSQGKI